jgi:hypothetical protein
VLAGRVTGSRLARRYRAPPPRGALGWRIGFAILWPATDQRPRSPALVLGLGLGNFLALGLSVTVGIAPDHVASSRAVLATSAAVLLARSPSALADATSITAALACCLASAAVSCRVTRGAVAVGHEVRLRSRRACPSSSWYSPDTCRGSRPHAARAPRQQRWISSS